MPDLPFEIHQAEGMLMTQLNSTIAVAVEQLRALAVAEGRELLDVADDVIAGRLRLAV